MSNIAKSWEPVVRALKKVPGVYNPWAVVNSMVGRGYRRKTESGIPRTPAALIRRHIYETVGGRGLLPAWNHVALYVGSLPDINSGRVLRSMRSKGYSPVTRAGVLRDPAAMLRRHIYESMYAPGPVQEANGVAALGGLTRAGAQDCEDCSLLTEASYFADCKRDDGGRCLPRSGVKRAAGAVGRATKKAGRATASGLRRLGKATVADVQASIAPAIRAAIKHAAGTSGEKTATDAVGKAVGATVAARHGIGGVDVDKYGNRYATSPTGDVLGKAAARALVKVAKGRSKRSARPAPGTGADSTIPTIKSQAQRIGKINDAIKRASVRRKKESESLPIHEFVRLQEAGIAGDVAASGDLKDANIEVVVLSEGAGNIEDNNYYPRELVQRSAPLFEGVKSFLNHPKHSEERDRPERDVLEVCGWFYDAHVRDIDGKASLCARLRPTRSSAGREAIDLIHSEIEYRKQFPESVLVGFSVNASGYSAERVVDGKTYNVVTDLSHATSVDIVTFPARGGRVLSVTKGAADERSMGVAA